MIPKLEFTLPGLDAHTTGIIVFMAYWGFILAWSLFRFYTIASGGMMKRIQSAGLFTMVFSTWGIFTGLILFFSNFLVFIAIVYRFDPPEELKALLTNILAYSDFLADFQARFYEPAAAWVAEGRYQWMFVNWQLFWLIVTEIFLFPLGIIEKGKQHVAEKKIVSGMEKANMAAMKKGALD